MKPTTYLTVLALVLLAAIYWNDPLNLSQMPVSEYEDAVHSSTYPVTEAFQKKHEGYFDLNQSLSDPQCQWHLQAQRMNKDYNKGKGGLDNIRYNKTYKHFYYEKKGFDRETHEKKYPGDTVLDNNYSSSGHISEGYVVLTNRD